MSIKQQLHWTVWFRSRTWPDIRSDQTCHELWRWCLWLYWCFHSRCWERVTVIWCSCTSCEFLLYTRVIITSHFWYPRCVEVYTSLQVCRIFQTVWSETSWIKQTASLQDQEAICSQIITYMCSVQPARWTEGLESGGVCLCVCVCCSTAWVFNYWHTLRRKRERQLRVFYSSWQEYHIYNSNIRTFSWKFTFHTSVLQCSSTRQ